MQKGVIGVYRYGVPIRKWICGFNKLVPGANEKSEGPAKTFSLKVIPCFSWAMDNKDRTDRSGEFLSEFGMAILKTEVGS